MTRLSFPGFGGLELAAEQFGDPDHPPVLFLHGAGQSRRVWDEAAAALVAAGRSAVLLDLRGHGESGGAASDPATLIGDVRAVLAAMPARPVVVAASLGAALALAALGEASVPLASALVLTDPPGARPAFPSAGLLVPAERLAAAAPRLAVPALVAGGALAPHDTESLAAAIADCEQVAFPGAADADRVEAFNALLLDFLERRTPLLPPEYRAGSDMRTLRDALGCFATGVTIVTAMAPDGSPVGLTANSFTSLSLDPPLLLVCIARTASSLPALDAASHFAVNVLHIGQQPASTRFARSGGDRFAEIAWEAGEFGAPLIRGSLASFECARHAAHEGGDHVILVGRVEKARFEPRRDPLLYFRGRYRRLHFS